MYQLENVVIISVLLILLIIYIYLLISPSQPKPFSKLPNAVIQPDTIENFKKFMDEVHGYTGGGGSSTSFYGGTWNYSSEFGAAGHHDDFFLEGFHDDKYPRSGSGNAYGEDKYEPLIPSADLICGKIWLTMRSEMNYKYLWMHATESQWLGASATMDTPIHRKSFYLQPVTIGYPDSNHSSVLLREGDSESFIYMVHPNDTMTLTADGIMTTSYATDAWVIKLGTSNLQDALTNPRYHWLIERDGYVINVHAMACINIMAEAEYTARGHSNGWNRNSPAGREFGSAIHFEVYNESDINKSISLEESEKKTALDEDLAYQKQIVAFPQPSVKEKRVISYGLYGSKAKYTLGAIHNAQLAATYFPGWISRYYVTSDVPPEVLGNLTALGAEIVSIPAGMGYTSGMFWRFMVASDPTVDRYIIRDVDSRLNARDRIAVEEWIQLKYPIHIMRDHVNHCIVMNGGMWGGVKGAIQDMEAKILAWENKNEYMADLHFLDQKIWPDIKHQQISHDSYCCDRYPNTRPFPTRRAMTYQHVGQVFDELDRPRLTDIDGFIRGVPIPSSCRKQADWIYG